MGTWENIASSEDFRVYAGGEWFNPCDQDTPFDLWVFVNGEWVKGCEGGTGVCNIRVDDTTPIAVGSYSANTLSLTLTCTRDLQQDAYLHVITGIVSHGSQVGFLLLQSVTDSRGNAYTSSTSSLAVMGATRSDVGVWDSPDAETLMFGPSAIGRASDGISKVPAGGLQAGDTISLTFQSGDSGGAPYSAIAMVIPLTYHHRQIDGDGFYGDGNAFPGGSDDGLNGTALYWEDWGTGWTDGAAQFRLINDARQGKIITGVVAYDGPGDWTPADPHANKIAEYSGDNLYLAVMLSDLLEDGATYESGGSLAGAHTMLAANYQSLSLDCPV